MNIKDKMGQLTEESFKQALAYLIINSSFMDNLGLFHGKMGVVLFFSIYSRFSKNELYNQFAYVLLDEINMDIHENTLTDFENGLSGIGWAIEYLVQNGYMEGDTDEILEDIDVRMMEYDIGRILNSRDKLIGILYYLCARLSAIRESNRLPFDSGYLNNLKKVLTVFNSSNIEDFPSCLMDDFFNLLQGGKSKKIELPASLQFPDAQMSEKFYTMSLGLKDGLTGILLHFILTEKQVLNVEPIFSQRKKRIVIFDEESRAANYGVGTYIGLLVDAFKNDQYEVVVVHLHSPNVEPVLFERSGNVIQMYISNVKVSGAAYSREKQNKYYYRNITLLLNLYFDTSMEYIFQLNYMGMEELAKGLKKNFPYSRILVTVHYTNWGFILSGNKNKLHKILELGYCQSEKDKQLLKSIDSERRLFNFSDQVIGVAKHSYNDLLTIYGVPKYKLSLIPHGIKDTNLLLTERERGVLKEKYGFKVEEQILIFAGRLDVDKGIELLADSFIRLQKVYPKLRLIIAGSGNYSNIFKRLIPSWSNVVFTGFVDKDILYELFSISDVGVLPSFYEEFGYFALEMMMMGLPLVVAKTSGLSELVVNGVSGITVTVKQDKNEENIVALQSAIRKLLDNSLLRKQYAENGRLRFLQCYNFELFVQRTKACFE